VDREEFINAGVIFFCLQRRFLESRIHFDEQRLRALWPDVDVHLVRRHLQAFVDISAGDQAAGPIAALTQRERFHWLVAPRSTMIQVSPVHSGICDEDLQAKLDHLVKQLLGV
jgi:hypothetical protein